MPSLQSALKQPAHWRHDWPVRNSASFCKRGDVMMVVGRRPNSFQELSLNVRTILFLVILLDKTVSVG